jgi:hypothetical protein
MNVFYADELGVDFFTNETVLSSAIAAVGTAADLDALMAEVESLVTVYDPGIEFEEFDNTGVTVTLDDGTELSYDEYSAGQDGEVDADVPVYPDIPVDPIDVGDSFEWLDAAARKKTIGISEMSQMGSDI